MEAAESRTTRNGQNNQQMGLLKTGLAILTSADGSTDAEAEEGVAEAYSNIVAVMVDGEGRILNCAIDSAQTRLILLPMGRLQQLLIPFL